MRHHTINLIIFAAAIGTTCLRAKAQVSPPAHCATIRVNCTDIWQPGPITCTATVGGADPRLRPTFRWTVSNEMTIVSGQGTSTLTVEWQKLNYFLAAVNVVGLPPGCESSGEYITIFDPGPRKVVEYGVVPAGVEKSHLDRLADELRKEPTAQGYVLSYAGRRAWAGEALWRGERARRHLLRKGGFDPRQIVTIDGGYKETRNIELYIVPSGVSPPPASPTVEPGEVKVIGRKHKLHVRP